MDEAPGPTPPVDTKGAAWWRNVAYRMSGPYRSAVGRIFATNGVVLALGMIGSILLARALGPAGRGEIAAAMLWPTLLSYLGSLGIISSVVYHASIPEADVGAVFGTATLLAVGQSLLTIGIGYLLLPVLLGEQSGEVLRLARLYLLVIPCNLMSQYAMAIIQAGLRFRAYNVLRLLVPASYLGAILLLHAADRLTVRHVVISHLLFSGVLAATACGVARALGLVARLRVDRPHARRMLAYGVKVHAGTLSQAANLRVDQALITAWFPPAQLGLYVAAVSAASVNQVFSSAVETVLVPRIARSHSAESRASALRAVFSRYWVLNLLASASLAAVMPFAIPLVFGPEFASATLPAVVLVLATFLLGSKDVLAGGARAMGNPWLGSRAEIVASVVTLALLPALLPIFGILGAAVVAVLTNATQVTVVLWGLGRTHRISLRGLLGLGSQSGPPGDH